MDNIYKIPDRSVIEYEAAAWLIKMDGDQALSATDDRALREWIKRSPVHREEISSLAAFWGNNILTELAVPLGKPDRQRKAGMFATLVHSLSGFGPAWIGVAIVVAAIGIFMLPKVIALSMNSTNGLYATAVGQQTTTILADGSVVQLNTNSQLDIEFTDDFRDVRLLQGEAHFTVAKNTQRPFRVYAGNGRIQAVGTAFSVYLKDDGVKVTVTEGRVAIESFDQPTALEVQQQIAEPVSGNSRVGGMPDVGEFTHNLGDLKAGQTTTIRRTVKEGMPELVTLDAIEFIDKQELANRLSWRRGLLIFAGDPLEDVVAEVSRYTTVNIEITDPNVRAMKIGGQFPAGETDKLLDVLETHFGLRVTRMGYNSVQLSAASD